MEALQDFAITFIELSTLVLAFVIGLLILAVIYMYIADITQKKQTIRRNYPVIGRFRYFFEHLGEFFRQYFFAQDREELPFNRAQRSWVYRAAKNLDSTVAFGSTPVKPSDPRSSAATNASITRTGFSSATYSSIVSGSNTPCDRSASSMNRLMP